VKAKENNAQVTEATRYLLKVRLPEVAKILADEKDKVVLQHVSVRLQQFGVNLRYLGRIRSHIAEEKKEIRQVGMIFFFFFFHFLNF
jgi:hypothetical protein